MAGPGFRWLKEPLIAIATLKPRQGWQKLAHGVSREYPNPPSPPAPLPLGRERGAEGRVRAVPPRAYALGYFLTPLTGLLTRGRFVSTYVAND